MVLVMGHVPVVAIITSFCGEEAASDHFSQLQLIEKAFGAKEEIRIYSRRAIRCSICSTDALHAWKSASQAEARD